MRRLLAWGQGNRIGKRMIVLIIVFSSLITLVTTAIQLYLDYRQQRQEMESVLETAAIYVPVIADSVWALDKHQIDLVLSALVQMPNIAQARVQTEDHRREWKASHSADFDPAASRLVTREFVLKRQMRGEELVIGQLQIVASLDAIYRSVLTHAISILVSNGLKTFMVAIFMFVLFRRIVTERLEALAQRVAALPPRVLSEALPETPVVPSAGDEIDAVSAAFDAMGERLQQSVDALRRHQLQLEEVIALRTAELVEQKEYLAIALRDRTRSNEELSRTLEVLQDTQEELISREKLAALGALVAGVAHELNTPIGNSLTSASTLHDLTGDIQQKLAEGLKRSSLESYLQAAGQATDIMVRNLQRAASLLNGFKQVAVDQTSSQRRAFEVDTVVRELLMTLQPTLGKTPYVVECDIPAGLKIESYPGPLGQVLTNLVNNAILHGFDGREHGTIRIHAREVDAERIELRVSDDGRGIPPAHVPHVFDPFFTTKMGRGGTGLGLNIVHGIVSGILGGKISVNNDVHQGAEFVLRLPRQAPSRVAADTSGQ